MGDAAGARSANLFATLLLSYVWPDAAELNPPLRTAILEHAGRHPGDRRTNIGGWHSAPGSLEFCGEAGHVLIGHIHAMAGEAMDRLYAEFGRPAQQLSWVLSAWANVNRCGDFNQIHTHPGATWSGVYYVDRGEGPGAEEGAAAALHLYDPNPARANLFLPELSTANVVFRPEPGLMVLFPAYVPHEVPPHRGSRERVSIAFNLRREPFP